MEEVNNWRRSYCSLLIMEIGQFIGGKKVACQFDLVFFV
jgi:hypothetical protein